MKLITVKEHGKRINRNVMVDHPLRPGVGGVQFVLRQVAQAVGVVGGRINTVYSGVPG